MNHQLYQNSPCNSQSTTAREPLIPLQIKDIHSHLAELLESIRALASHLEPVCSPLIEKDSGEPPRIEASPSCKMQVDLKDILTNIKQGKDILRRLHSCIEI